MVLALPGTALAQIFVAGNPSCQSLNADDVLFPEITSDFGFKIEGDYNRTVPMDGTASGTSLTGGAPADPVNTVTVSSQDNLYFDWSSTLGMDAVIVKGGPNADAYVYSPEAFEDWDLHAPINPSNGQPYGISHIEFCYDYELTASKTADAEYTRTYSWEITKDYDGEYWKFIGDPATSHGYEVTVDQTVTDSDWIVSGEITVFNGTPYDNVLFDVEDFVDGVEAIVDCPKYEIDAGETVICTYDAYVTGPDSGTNTATVASDTYPVGGATAEADYAFGDPTTIVGYPEINVTDTNGEGWMASGDDSWTYSKDFVCPTDVSLYEGGVHSFTHTNTATITETTQSDDATVKVNCYAPVPSKDANAKYTRQYDWTITKDYDGEYWKFIGDPATSHGYEVSVDQTVSEYDFVVDGTITVHNPNPKAAMTVSLVDSVGGTAATLGCGGTLVVPAGGSATCGYSADLLSKTDGTNTATATLNDIDFDATADYAFGDPTTTVGDPEVDVTDTNGMSWMASGDASWTYSKELACPTDTSLYVNGAYSFTHTNTATITQTGQSDIATVKVNCYAPVPSKDADTSYTRQYDWTITKDDDGTYKKFIGDPDTSHGYLVSVDQTISEYDFVVSGTITVYNPNPTAAMTVSLVDSVGGTAATLDCGGTLVVPAGGSATCGYSASLGAKTDGTNTATATLNGIGFDATAGYAFGDPTNTVGYPNIDVTDTNGMSWTASGDASWTYSKDFGCPTDKSLYVNGQYGFTHVNTAEITQTGQSDDATVTVSCYAPVLSKDASASYDERHDWDVVKTVSPEMQGGFAGDVLSWTWTVYVSETFVEENFAVSGNINVSNPAGSPGDMMVSLADLLNDGTVANVDCGGGATSVTVAPGATGTCAYTASPDGRTATENKATGTFNGVGGFVATYPVEFVKNVINGTATVTDTEIGLNTELTAGGGPWTYTKDYSHTCSSNRADYFVGGAYTQMKWTIENWAYVYSGGVEQDKDDATTMYTCDASFVDIYKTTNGQPADPAKDIAFALYSGETSLETVSTLNNGANLSFQTALVPGAGYTICESPVPAGYTFEISVNGGVVLTYAGPPGEQNPTGEVQCFDFVAEIVGTTVTFEIDNRFPGGAPRTPGYWKNWNRCSGGNQAETADKLNDYLGPIDGAGVFLLDDLLPQTIGDFTVATCEDGVNILDARELDGRNKGKANDAAYTLARALLAARLNQDAGACVPPSFDPALTYDGLTFDTFEEVLTAADGVLSDVGFSGTGDYLGPKNKSQKDLASYALWLYEIIDDYNNSFLCAGEPSHQDASQQPDPSDPKGPGSLPGPFLLCAPHGRCLVGASPTERRSSRSKRTATAEGRPTVGRKRGAKARADVQER